MIGQYHNSIFECSAGATALYFSKKFGQQLSVVRRNGADMTEQAVEIDTKHLGAIKMIGHLIFGEHHCRFTGTAITLYTGEDEIVDLFIDRREAQQQIALL